mmetsp:Transcript_117893/g.186743  ORF Transcript_117893/g.186743 Transcript_117893/m.186743 type:complete len:1123 (-) Transcript_117893:235-3603(-)
MTSSDEEEKRLSPEDGVAYTRQEFLQYYGDLEKWEAAAPKEDVSKISTGDTENPCADQEGNASNTQKRTEIAKEDKIDDDEDSSVEAEFIDCSGEEIGNVEPEVVKAPSPPKKDVLKLLQARARDVAKMRRTLDAMEQKVQEKDGTNVISQEDRPSTVGKITEEKELQDGANTISREDTSSTVGKIAEVKELQEEDQVADPKKPKRVKTKKQKEQEHVALISLPALPDQEVNGPRRAASTDEHKWPASLEEAHEDIEVAKPRRSSEADVTGQMVCLMGLAFLIPNLVLLGVFSHLGNGLAFYNFVASTIYNLIGSGCIIAAFLICMGYYISDWEIWTCRCFKLSVLAIPAFLLIAACGLKARAYPFLPVVLTIAFTPLMCGALRATLYRTAKRRAFYMIYAEFSAIAAVLLMCTWGGWITAGNSWDDSMQRNMANSSASLFEIYTISDPRIWQDMTNTTNSIRRRLSGVQERALSYDLDCGPEKDRSGLSAEVKGDVGVYCKKTMTVLFTIWSCPLPGALSNAFLGIAAFVNGVMLDLDKEGNLARLEMVVKGYLFFLSIIFMGMYLSTSISGASIYLGKTLMAFFVAAMSVLVAGVYVEVGQRDLKDLLSRSPIIRMLMKAASSDWAKAVFVGGLNIWIPIFLFSDTMRMRCRHCRHATVKARCQRFSPLARKLVDTLKTWNWASIFVKICLLGELFFTFQVGVAKATYIFLSWLNSMLASVDYGVVIVLIFIIGYTMFLLPPVPGVPVYVFCGIVVAEQGRQLEQIGFFLGCIIACLLAWVLKLSACTGQYYIGYCAGKSIKIQQLIGVDKVPTRAIEKILRERGLTLGKVSVLVGGPDWPTSVTCGILRLSVPQMLLGTAPVFFVSSPCVLAGAFLARVNLGEESIWSALSNAFLAISAIGQMVSMLLAIACITKVAETDFTALSRPRPEHAAIEDLTKREADYQIKYSEVTDFTRRTSLSRRWKILICIGASLQILSGFLFVFGADYCFRPFAVSSDINAPYEENGLNGNAIDILLPIGWVASGMFLLGVVCHLVFAQVANRRTAAEVNPAKPVEAEPPKPRWKAVRPTEEQLQQTRALWQSQALKRKSDAAEAEGLQALTENRHEVQAAVESNPDMA